MPIEHKDQNIASTENAFNKARTGNGACQPDARELAGQVPDVLSCEDPGETPEENLEEKEETGQQEDLNIINRELGEQVERLSMEKEVLFGRLQRLQADFENLRRRSAREREEMTQFATRNLIISLLPVMDNLERALAAGKSNLESLTAGLNMIYQQFGQVLVDGGLERVKAIGDVFDPEIHEAVEMVLESGLPGGTITEELQPGYLLHGRLLRPAMVKVAG